MIIQLLPLHHLLNQKKKRRKKSGEFFMASKADPFLPCPAWSGIDLSPKFEKAIGKLLALSSIQWVSGEINGCWTKNTGGFTPKSSICS